MKNKNCTTCNQIKPLSEFYHHKYTKDKLHSVCKECFKINKENWSKVNKDRISKYNKQYKENHIQYYKIYNKIWKKNNRSKIRIYEYNLYKENVEFQITCCLRARMYSALKGEHKSLSTMMLIGCEIDYLMFHIQKQFQSGMSWDNYGLWHIDHKLPCASFDFSTASEQHKCFHYSNLQPLWAKDNFCKGNKIL